MQFDPTKLPKDLALFEAATFQAFGEALSIEDLGEIGWPSARRYEPQIQQAFERCVDEALYDPKCDEFVKMLLPRPSSPVNLPATGELRECERSWPPTGHHLASAIGILERNESGQTDIEDRIRRLLHECIEEAIGKPQFADFLALLISKRPQVIASDVLQECKASWPPTGEVLCELVSEQEHAIDDDQNRLKEQIKELRPKLARAGRSGIVRFEGEFGGVRGEIHRSLFNGATDIDIYTGTIETIPDGQGTNAGRTLRWTKVHIERKSFEERLRAAATDDDIEAMAINALGEHLKSNPHLTRTEADGWLKRQGYVVSGRGFQSRVWPGARARAGLSAKAPPGPKPRPSE